MDSLREILNGYQRGALGKSLNDDDAMNAFDSDGIVDHLMRHTMENGV